MKYARLYIVAMLVAIFSLFGGCASIEQGAQVGPYVHAAATTALVTTDKGVKREKLAKNLLLAAAAMDIIADKHPSIEELQKVLMDVFPDNEEYIAIASSFLNLYHSHVPAPKETPEASESWLKTAADSIRAAATPFVKKVSAPVSEAK